MFYLRCEWIICIKLLFINIVDINADHLLKNIPSQTHTGSGQFTFQHIAVNKDIYANSFLSMDNTRMELSAKRRTNSKFCRTVQIKNCTSGHQQSPQELTLSIVGPCLSCKLISIEELVQYLIRIRRYGEGLINNCIGYRTASDCTVDIENARAL